MPIFHVSPTGAEDAEGGPADPFGSIGAALRSGPGAGDVVLVMPGAYREAVRIERGGAPGAPLVIRAEIPGAARIRAPDATYSAVTILADHVRFEGFDVVGGSGHAIDVESAHHVEIVGNVAHDSGGGGIAVSRSEFVTIHGNVAYGNAATNGYQTSGISVYQARAISGDATTPGYRIVVTNNVSFDNTATAALPGEHTDGNGVIIDDFRSTQAPGFPSYPYPTLVANNLVHGNGGKGVAVHWSDHVTVANNTAFANNRDPLNPGDWRGELSNIQSSGNRWINNIAVADRAVDPRNTAVADLDYGGYRNADVRWTRNVTFDGRPDAPSARAAPGAGPSEAEGNLLGVDPRLIDPEGGDFRLAATSPAIDAGAALPLPALDAGGRARLVGALDIGAYERAAAERDAPNRTPLALADEGFTVLSGARLTIPPGRLLANDLDADGDALTVGALGPAAHGAARLEPSGEVVFEAARGYAGPARFAYAATDGHGGAGWAAVSLSVTARHAEPAPEATLFGDAPPSAAVEIGERRSYELGLRFAVEEDAVAAALRYWRGEMDSRDVDSRDLTLWSAEGEPLARARAVSTPGESGWRVADLPAPVALRAGSTYVVSYGTTGDYALTEEFFSTPFAPLAGSVARVEAGAGVFSGGDGATGGRGTFPSATWRNSNYWVDVVFERPCGADAAPPDARAGSGRGGPVFCGADPLAAPHARAGALEAVAVQPADPIDSPGFDATPAPF